MAYKSEEIKILPGGMNLLAPGDQVSEGDCLDLTGFWPGAVGKLQQAPGFSYLTPAQLGSFFDSLCQTSGRTYYGGGGSLRQVGRGGAGETAIDTGYDGYPLGMIGYQGYLWIINRAKQRKDNGTTVSNWTPAAPALPALSNTAVTSAALTVVECDPGNPDSTTGDFSQIKVWISDSIAGLKVGSTVTISGSSQAALNTTGVVTDIFDGSPSSLIFVAVITGPIAAGTTFGTGGTCTFQNPLIPLGDHKYWITWAYTDLGESNPSSSAGVITAATQSVTDTGTKNTISIAALTPPTGAAYWNVYRQSPGMPSAYRLNGTPIPIATTTYDDFGDSDHSQDNDYLMDALGILMEGDHDAAPAARIMANDIYNGRIVVANSAAYPNRIWYTPALQPGYFRGSGNPQSGDWVDVGTDRGDEILYIAVKPGRLIVFRAKSIWHITGDFKDANSRVEVVVPDFGVVGPRAVACTSLGDYFRAPEGIYKFNGDWAQPISAKLDPIFRELGGENFAAEAKAYRSNCALGFNGGRLWVSYTWGGSTVNNASFVWHVATDRWFARQFGVGAFLNTGAALLGGLTNFAVTLETGYVDGIGNTIVAYQSAYNDCGQPDHEKSWADLIVNHNTGGQTLTIAAHVNGGKVSADRIVLDTTLISSANTKTIVPLVYPAAHALAGKPLRAFNLSIRITGTGPAVSPGIEIATPLILHYYLEARKARVFDTDETDHGMPGVVKVVDQVEFDIDAPTSDGLLQIYSDIPDGAMAARLGTGLAIPATTGRQTVKLVLATPINGKLLRYVATSTAGFSVYGFRARVLPIGVYVDGANLETWDTRAIPIAR